MLGSTYVPVLLLAALLVPASSLVAEEEPIGFWIVSVGIDGEDLRVEHVMHEPPPPPAGGHQCGGTAPVTRSCSFDAGEVIGLGRHGFVLPDCVDGAVHFACYVGILESRLEADNGEVRTFRWKAAYAAGRIADAEEPAHGWLETFPANVVQTCSSYSWQPRPDLTTYVTGGVGNWLCFYEPDKAA